MANGWDDRFFNRIIILASLVIAICFDSARSFCGDHTLYQEYIWDGSNLTDKPNDTTLFQQNLDSVLYYLPTEDFLFKYRFTSYYQGKYPNAAYATALCIGGIDYTTCLSCVRTATKLITEDCSVTENSAIIWYGNCVIRYSNHQMHSVLSTDDNMIRVWNNTADVEVSKVDAFDGVRAKLFSALANRAEQRINNYTMFAAGKKFEASSNKMIYGAVQCSPDLYAKLCSDCLAIIGKKVEETCSGKVGGRVVGPNCNFQFDIYPFINDSSLVIYDFSPPSPPSPSGLGSPPPMERDSPFSPAIFSPPPPKSPSSKGKGVSKSLIAISIVAPVLAICIILSVFTFFLKRRKTQEIEVVDGSNNEEGVISVHNIKTEETLQYSFSSIRIATENFSEANVLGQGGFGTIYKGRLPEGEEIAVKRLSQTSAQGDIEFKNEVTLMTKLQHRNLVRLLGFCLKEKERLLIYEFVANCSLDKIIFDPKKRASLTWDRRYKIIGGIARGLLYLHEDSRLRIIHRDLKSSNILLDVEMNAKIADFGMARLYLTDETYVNTNKIVGTFGYMAPEYANHGQFSVKSDVFSFGVLLLEIVSGRRNRNFHVGDKTENLLSYAWHSWQEGEAMNVIDSELTYDTGSAREMMRCIHIGLLCAQESVSERPTMALVIRMLDNLSIALPNPLKPVFYPRGNNLSQGGSMLQDHSSGGSDQSRGSRREAFQTWSSMLGTYPR